MNEVALVRNEPPGDEDGLAEIRDEISRLTLMIGNFAFSHGEQISDSVNHYIWFGPIVGDEIAVIDDFSTPVRYVAVRGGTPGRSAQLVDAVRAVVNHMPVTELLTRAAHAEDDPATLVRLALSLTSPDPASKALFVRALASPSQTVRHHALFAAALVRWPELLPELRSLAASEEDESLRRLAQHAVQACSPPERSS